MFSYYSLGTWLFTFFSLVLLGFLIYYTRKLCAILFDIKKSKKVSYEPWKKEKEWAKVKKIKTSRPKIRLPIITIPVIKYGKAQKTESQPTFAQSNGKPDRTENGLNRSEGIVGSYESFQSFETTTTNSEFYRDPRLSIDLNDNRPWFLRPFYDQNQNYVKNSDENFIETRIPFETILPYKERTTDPKQLPKELNVRELESDVTDSEGIIKVKPKLESTVNVTKSTKVYKESSKLKTSKLVKKTMIKENSELER